MYKCINRRVPTKIELGKIYIVWFDPDNKMLCKFIQPTRCGYNFLNLKTNKCILKHHLYPSKKENHSSGDYFWININMKIRIANNVVEEIKKE